MKSKKLALPYILWMFVFTLVPLILVISYAIRDDQGNFTFEFLSKVISLQEDMIDEMRDHGLAYACLAYRNNQVLEQKRKQIAKREQALGM